MVIDPSIRINMHTYTYKLFLAWKTPPPPPEEKVWLGGLSPCHSQFECRESFRSIVPRGLPDTPIGRHALKTIHDIGCVYLEGRATFSFCFGGKVDTRKYYRYTCKYTNNDPMCLFKSGTRIYKKKRRREGKAKEKNSSGIKPLTSASETCAFAIWPWFLGFFYLLKSSFFPPPGVPFSEFFFDGKASLGCSHHSQKMCGGPE